MGAELTVLPSAQADLAAFKVGDKVTLLLTTTGQVAGAVSVSYTHLDVYKRQGEDSLSWYVTGWASGGSTSGGTSAEGQLNEKGAHYTYLVLG